MKTHKSRSSSLNRYSRRLVGLESLERRTVLAGSVMAELSGPTGGLLTLNGDADDNQLVISGTGTPGTVVVRGALSGDDASSATKVGISTEPVTFTNVTGIEFKLGAGDDAVLVTDLNLEGGLSGNLGAGDDRFVISGNDSTTAQMTLNDEAELEIGPVSIAGDIDLSTGAGDDVVRMVGGAGDENLIEITGDVTLNTGANDDTIVLRRATAGSVTIAAGTSDDRVTLRGLEVAGTLSVNTGRGDDQLELRNIETATLEMATGGGDDEVSARLNNVTATTADIRTGRGSDKLEIRDSLFTALTLRLGTGNDKAALLDVQVEGTLTASGGAGNDHLSLDNVTAVDAVLNTGIGNDSIQLIDSEFDDLEMDLGDGNDRLTVEGTTATAFALASSKGKDMVKDRGDNEIPGLEDLTEKKNSDKKNSGKSSSGKK